MVTRRYAVITPYYREERWLLERCIRSVRAQSVHADHFMVADGHPQDWIDNEPVRHVKLDRGHADFGNTPRGLGALLAIGEGYDGIALLDADNWLESNHIQACAEASLRSEDCDYVIARRHLRRPDGSILDTPDAPISRHVDTSCFFLLPGSYHLLSRFPLYPRGIAQMCDQLFYLALRENNMKPQVIDTKTVNYHCLWAIIYREAGEVPPPEADHRFDMAAVRNWFATRTRRELDVAYRDIGCKVRLRGPVARPAGPAAEKAAARPPQTTQGMSAATHSSENASANPVVSVLPRSAKRYVIITPYFKEARPMLERCIASVRAQTLAVDHFLVADGFPQGWIDGEPVRHIKLDRSHADYGNTPRAIGAIMAAAEAYDGIGLLDADNWLEPDHVASCVEASRRVEDCDYVIALRHLRRPDGSILAYQDEAPETLVDTSCYFLLPGSYHVLPHFGTMPKELSPICDRVFHAALRTRALRAAMVGHKTVNYLCLWPGPYIRAGEVPPVEADHWVDRERMAAWMNSRGPRERDVVNRLVGSRIRLRRRPGPSAPDATAKTSHAAAESAATL